MALTTLADVRAVPGLQNVVKVSDAWLNTLIPAASLTIQNWTKQNLELSTWTEFYNGNEQPDLVLNQFPLWAGTTQIASGSNGVTLPTATINVVSTQNPDGTSAFDPGGRSGQQPTIAVQTGLMTWTVVTYTGLTATSFTGCSGGTGTLSSANAQNGINQPVVWVDTQAYSGFAPPSVSPYAPGTGPFAPGTLQVQGVNYYPVKDRGGNTSRRALLRRVGGYGTFGFWNNYPVANWMGGSKLASYRAACWPRGYGNIKVQYSAGYQIVPPDLNYCATTLVASMVRNQPKGTELSSEGLGSYSYSILASSSDPDIGNVRRILSRYAEMSW